MQRLPARFLALAGLIAILLIAFFQFRESLIAESLARALGADVGIRQVNSLYLTGISVSGLTIATENTLFSADVVDLSVDLSDYLFNDQITVEHIQLTNANLIMTQTSSQPEAEVSLPIIVLKSFTVMNMRLDYEDADQDFVVIIEQCGSEQQTDSVQWKCNGSVEEEAVQVSGHYGLPDVAGNTEPFNLDLTWQDVALNVVGEMEHPTTLEDAQLTLELKADRSTPLLRLLGVNEVRDSPIELVANYWDTEVGFIVSTVGRIGEMQFTVGGSADSFKSPEKAALTVDLSGPSLYEAGALFDYLQFQDVPFSIEGRIVRGPDFGLTAEDILLTLEDGTVIGSLSMPAFPSTEDMSLAFGGDEISPTLLQPLVGTCELPKEKLAWYGQVNIAPDGTEAVDFTVAGTRHRLDVRGTLNTRNEPGAEDLAIRSSGFSLKEFGRCFDLVLPDVTTSLNTTFSWDDDLLTFRDISLDSSIVNASGTVFVGTGTDVPFTIDLAVSTPDARQLTESLFGDAGPLNSFRLGGDIRVSGDRNDIPDFSFQFSAGNHIGAIDGALGATTSLEGLILNLAMDGENLGELLVDPEAGTPSGQKFSFKSKLQHSNDTWRLEELLMTIASTRITGSGTTTGTGLLNTRIELNGAGDNLADLLGPWIDMPVPAVPFTVDVIAENLEQELHVKDFLLQMGEHQIASQMMIDNPPDFSGSHGSLTMSGPSTRELFDTLGIAQPMLDRPYELSFNIDGETDQLLINQFAANVGESDIRGFLTMAHGEPPTVHARLESESLYLPLFNPDMLDEPGETSSKQADVFPATPLPFDVLKRFDGSIQYEASKVWRSPDYATSIRLSLDVADGALSTREFTWEGEDARGELAATAIPVGDTYDITVSAQSDRLPLIWLLAGDAEPSGDTQFNLDIESHGVSVKELMANMNGTILFKGGPGQLKGNALHLYFGDFMHSIATRISDHRPNLTRISCTAGAINIVNGEANLSPGFLARTDKVDLFATGTINLDREKPDLAVLTKSRTGIGLSAAKVLAPRLKVKGTLASPKFQIDTTGTAVSAWLAVYSGGLSLIASGLWDRISGSSDACDDFYREARKRPEYNHYRRQSGGKSDT